MLDVSASKPRSTETEIPFSAEILEVSVRDNVILVRQPNSRYYALYAKPVSHSGRRKDGFAVGERPHLSLLRRKPTKDADLIARARQAAEEKARELGWIR